MPTKRFEKLDPAKRQRLLEAAMDVFGQSGLDANLQEVAERAGVAKALIYYYFEDRDDLLITLFDLVQTTLAELLSSVPKYEDAASFWDYVEAIFARGAAGLSDRVWMMSFMETVNHAVAAGAAPKGFDQKIRMMQRLIGQHLERGVALGALRSDLPADLFRLSAMSMMRTAEHWLFARIRARKLAEEDAKVVRRLLESAFGPLRKTKGNQLIS